MLILSNVIARLRFLFLFIVLVLFCFSKAVSAQFGLGQLDEFVLFVVIIYSLVIIGDRAKIFLLVLFFLAGLELLFLFLSVLFAFPILQVIKAFFIMLYFALMVAACLRYTFADKTIDITTLFGSLSAYLFIGLAYAYLYLWLSFLDPNAFTNIKYDADAIYYSFITLTTVGFGDIVPKKPIAQTFSWMESFIGQAYLAIIMAQLVGRYMAGKLNR